MLRLAVLDPLASRLSMLRLPDFRLPRGLLLLVATLVAPSACTAQGTGPIEFDHYHTLEEIGSYLEALAVQYPQLVTLDVIGRSREWSGS